MLISIVLVLISIIRNINFYFDATRISTVLQNDMNEFDLDKMRERLEAEIIRQRRSMTEVSLSAGYSKSYVRNIIKRDQIPSVDRLHAICEELKVSMSWVMYGLNLPPESSEIFDLLEKDPKRFYALLELARPQT
ncbi:MAG: helix-turn-helix transcriptional regulator [Sulfitobacter sp.]